MSLDNVSYDVSLQLSKTFARHGCTPDWVRIYLPMAFKLSKLTTLKILNEQNPLQDEYFEEALYRSFVIGFVFSILIERFCLAARINNRIRVAWGLSKQLIRGRCKPYLDCSCKLDYITNIAFKEIQFDFQTKGETQRQKKMKTNLNEN